MRTTGTVPENMDFFFKLYIAWYGTFQYNDIKLLNVCFRQEEFFSQNSRA